MTTVTTRSMSALLLATLLTGCSMLPMQDKSAMTVAPSKPMSLTEGWAKVIEMDRASVRLGQLPAKIIDYDQQIAKLLPEGQEILASHDQSKARAWMEKITPLNIARQEALGERTVAAAVSQNAAHSTWNDRKPDPCLSPMGKNICTPPAPQRGGVNYSAGPGGIGASMGGISVGPGGIGGVFGQ